MGASVNSNIRMGNHNSQHSSLSPRDMKVLGEHTHLNREQIKENFMKFKESTSGEDTISRRKFSNIMHQCFPRTHKTELEDYIFNLYDLNSNGTIEFQEFMIIVTIMNEGTPQSKLNQVFRVFDADENGFLSKDEFIKIVEHLFHLVPDIDKEHLTTPEMESTSLTDSEIFLAVIAALLCDV